MPAARVNSPPELGGGTGREGYSLRVPGRPLLLACWRWSSFNLPSGPLKLLFQECEYHISLVSSGDSSLFYRFSHFSGDWGRRVTRHLGSRARGPVSLGLKARPGVMTVGTESEVLGQDFSVLASPSPTLSIRPKRDSSIHQSWSG